MFLWRNKKILLKLQKFLWAMYKANILKISYTKVFDKTAYANNVDLDQAASEEAVCQDLHCLPLH